MARKTQPWWLLLSPVIVLACTSPSREQNPLTDPLLQIYPSLDSGLEDNPHSNTPNPWLNGFGGQHAGNGGEVVPVPINGAPDTPPVEPLDPEDPTAPLIPSLLFSEYFEGVGADKMLSIMALSEARDFNCEIEVYSNGGAQPWRRHAITGSLSEGQSLRICSESYSHAPCEQELSGSSFNGNDALVLRCFDQVVDSIGRVGENPGDAWLSQTPSVSTKDSHLLRCGSTPDEQPADAFIVDEQWTTWATDEERKTALSRCPSSSQGTAGGPNLAQ